MFQRDRYIPCFDRILLENSKGITNPSDKVEMSFIHQNSVTVLHYFIRISPFLQISFHGSDDHYLFFSAWISISKIKHRRIMSSQSSLNANGDD